MWRCHIGRHDDANVCFPFKNKQKNINLWETPFDQERVCINSSPPTDFM